MPKRKIVVKKHNRILSNGKIVPVKKHTRDIEKALLRYEVKQKIKNEKSHLLFDFCPMCGEELIEGKKYKKGDKIFQEYICKRCEEPVLDKRIDKKGISNFDKKFDETEIYLESLDDETIAGADCWVVAGLVSHALNENNIKNKIIVSTSGHYYTVFTNEGKEYYIDPTAKLQGFGSTIGVMPKISKENKRFDPVTTFNGVDDLIKRNSLAASFLDYPEEYGTLDEMLENSELGRLKKILA